MTPSELREWAAANKLLTTRSSDALASELLLKLTDPTPITFEFAERVNSDRVHLGPTLGSRWILTISTMGLRDLQGYITTIGDVNTLLWRAGLLDPTEGE